MIQPVLFVNVFFVPVLTLYLCYKLKGTPLVYSMELLFRYCITVSCNLLLTKLLLALPKIITGIYIPMDTVLYTLFAMVSACLLAILALIVKQISIEIKLTRIDESNETNSEKDR